MSLNGLDVNAVVEAHQSALADAGGWFLLKYANRDTVELLGQGTAGVAEAKGVVEQYEDKSPLYGMVQYRRKRVLLKYVPDGTSRLLQVRTSVQFQSILDAFPHDTVFSFTAAAELVESALGLCTMLQPANGETLRSSDSSMRQRRLNEISEDAEDINLPAKREEIVTTPQEPEKETVLSDNNSDLSTLPASALRAKALLAKRKEENLAASRTSAASPAPTPLLHPPDLLIPSFDDLQPEIASLPAGRPLSSLDQLKLLNEAEPASYKNQARALEDKPKRYHHSRHLSENESNTISQWNDQVAEYTLPTPQPQPQPKKKLAPRPHVDSVVRPRTASQYGDSTSNRPVANLPHSVRVSNRGDANFLVRPGSQQSTRSVPARFLPTSSMPPLPDFDHLQPPFLRPISRQAGSVTSSVVADPPVVSPEKMRLMKALQNRKRSQLLAQRAASAQSSFTTSSNRHDFPLGGPLSAQTSTLPKTISEENPAPVPAKKPIDSSTASPTSVATTSNEPSTRPSSFVDEQKRQSSQISLSHDTDSSSTPKAGPTRPTVKKHMSWFDAGPDLDDEPKIHTEPPVVPSSGEKTGQPESQGLPGEDDSLTERPPMKRQDRSALSWLANDSEVNIVHSLVQDGGVEPESQRETPPLLNVDTLLHSGTEESSHSEDEESEPEEIHMATVHQATPISVSRPPLTPTMRTVSHDRSRTTTKSSMSFSLSPQSSEATPNVRSKSPGNSLESFSTALPQWPPGNDHESMVPLSKKTTLGQGISQRIKALEDSSRRDSGAAPSPSGHEPSSNRLTFSNIMKRTSFISQSHTSGPSTERSHPKEASRPFLTTAPQPESFRLSRPWNPYQDPMFDAPKSTSDIDDVTLSNRTSHDQSSVGVPPSRGHEMERQSLITPLPLPPLLPEMGNATPDTSLTPASEKKRFSFASYRSGNSYRSASTAKWMQPEPMASRTSLVKEHKSSRLAGSETSSVNNDKRASRASRLMKRISGFGSRSAGKGQPHAPSREDLRPDPIMEQNENFARPASVAESLLQVVDIGDVNVQFPESLLWKRRFLRVDDQGYLIFSAPTENPTARSMNRKFHLADVQEPCLPDTEREVMAWSILLDLRDGNCIQCACESKQAQAKVLKMLLDAHSAYHSLYADPPE